MIRLLTASLMVKLGVRMLISNMYEIRAIIKLYIVVWVKYEKIVHINANK